MTAVLPPRRRPRLRRIGLWVLLIGLTCVFALPLLYMLATAFKTPAESVSADFRLWPQDPTLGAFRQILGDDSVPVLRWVGNSLLVAVAHCALTVVLAVLAAYALARMEFRGRRLMMGVILATMFVPAVVMLIPHFLIVNSLGWLNSYAALIIPGAAGAFGVFFLRQFFAAIPRELEEAAIVDGCTQWSTFARIMLPLARPAVATLVVLSFLASWNDYLWPVFVLFSSDMQTLPSGLRLLQAENSTRYDVMMAGAVIASAPVLALYVIAQRWIIEGVSTSGIKG
ncbi:N-acetyl-D-glucosamine ABC transporter permease [Brachybacterium phenoliresistens]|uniref:N-acetyl-D-glucosamine ABC transporter permease n=1 Tax=Brachybacterium phenoliresistens TaxID=396014 RepID=Z9JVV2_9MICO|nr:carbohydrate ABC transporter permease [Brachybacterium phenoliresistens]EWS82334.1 N-acetyl-D-glucosamine ABC transporter permease [Brachybacterium phenoliresistens]